MKKKEIQIGQIYAAKISGKVVPVKILSKSHYKGWDGKNIKTDRDIRIKSASKLRFPLYYSDRLKRYVAIPD